MSSAGSADEIPVPERREGLLPAEDGAAALPALPRIPYLRLRITLRAAERAILPPFKGSTLRGAFGHALRTAVCAFGPDQPCETCRLRHACSYARLFEPVVEGTPPYFLGGFATAPRPYLFEPSEDGGRRLYEPGDPLELDLLLFGEAAALQGYALLGVERMAAAGLGRDRLRFEMTCVRALGPGGWRSLFEDGHWHTTGLVPPILPSASGLGEGRLEIRFLTPARIKVQGRLAATLGFRDLVYAMWTRLVEIAYFHVPGATIDWACRPLLDLASQVRLTACELAWQDLERYSNRQKAKVSLGGIVGRLEVEGDLEPFSLLLSTAEVVHVGKSTTFGSGRLELRKLDRLDPAVERSNPAADTARPSSAGAAPAAVRPGRKVDGEPGETSSLQNRKAGGG